MCFENYVSKKVGKTKSFSAQILNHSGSAEEVEFMILEFHYPTVQKTQVTQEFLYYQNQQHVALE